jgi:hypothetical protein
MYEHAFGRGRRLGIYLGAAASVIGAALAASPFASADQDVVVTALPEGSPTDVQSTPIIPDLLYDNTADQEYANYASLNGGPETLLTDQNVAQFDLTSADVGSEEVAQNTYMTSFLFGFEQTQVIGANGFAFVGNLGDIEDELITPYGDIPIFEYDPGAFGDLAGAINPTEFLSL